MVDNSDDGPAEASGVPTPQIGRTFGARGRGFTPPENCYSEERNPGRGGRGGFRGGRRGHGDLCGFRNRHYDGNNRGNFRGRRRENGSGDYENSYKDDSAGFRLRKNNQPEKKKELNIPLEPTENENELFRTGITPGINFNKYDKIDVKVSGDNVPKPITKFEDAGLIPLVLQNITKSNYNKPTPVQKSVIPIILNGRDLMACTQTGSGKTASFLIPIVSVLLRDPQDLIVTPEHSEPQVIIVSPVKELTIQIFEEAKKFSHGSSIKVCIAFDGTQIFYQLEKLLSGCHILVATPGRLMDFVNIGWIKLSSVRFVVLDEADRILDMGFLDEMRKLLENICMVPKGDRQTLLFSATFPGDIQRFAADFLHDYLFLAVGIVGGACSDVEQKFYSVSKFEKRKKLVELLEEHGSEKTLVFVELKRTADIIATYLSEKNYPTTSIHGDRLQSQREEALSTFKSGKMCVLVSTAVAARGLDIEDVAQVINYDLPKSIDEYVHRIGRTGRVGNKGLASSLFDCEQDGPLARDLIKMLAQAEQEVPDFMKEAAQGGGYGGGSGGGGESAFGGRDFRKFGQCSGLPFAESHIAEEESW